MVYKKGQGGAWNHVITGLLVLVVILVGLPFVSMVKKNADKITAEDAIKFSKDLLKQEGEDGFEAYDLESHALIDEEHLKSISSFNSLITSLQLVHDENLEVVTNTISASNTPTGGVVSKLVGMVPGVRADEQKCCKLESGGNLFYYHGISEGCTETESFCNPECKDNRPNDKTYFLSTQGGTCMEVNTLNNEIKIKGFELPQSVPEDMVGKLREWVTYNTDPDYVVYLYKFPSGEDTWNQEINRALLVGLGVRAGLNLLPFAGQIFKGTAVALRTFKKTAKSMMLINKLGNKKATRIVYKNLMGLEDQLGYALRGPTRTKLLSWYGDDGLIFFSRAKDARNRISEVSRSSSLRSDYINNLDDYADGLAYKLGLPNSKADDAFKQTLRDVLETGNLDEFDNYLINKLDETNIRFNFGPEKIEGEEFLEVFFRNSDSIRKLDGHANKLVNRYNYLKRTDPSKFDSVATKELEAAVKNAEDILGKGGVVNWPSMTESEISLMMNSFTRNQRNLDELFGGLTLGDTTRSFWRGSLNFMGADNGQLRTLLLNQVKYGVACPTSIVGVAGGGAVTASAIMTAPLTAGTSALVLPLSTAGLTYSATQAAKYCGGFIRKNIFPLLVFYSFMANDAKNVAQKSEDQERNTLYLQKVDDFELKPQAKKLNNFEDSLVVLKGVGVPGKVMPAHFVSPCKADFTVRQEFCKVEFEDTQRTILVRQQTSQNKYVLVPYKPKEGLDIERLINQGDLHEIYLWDLASDKSYLLENNLKDGVNFLADNQVKQYFKLLLNDVKDTYFGADYVDEFLEGIIDDNNAYPFFYYMAEGAQKKCDELVEDMSKTYIEYYIGNADVSQAQNYNDQVSQNPDSKFGSYDYMTYHFQQKCNGDAEECYEVPSYVLESSFLNEGADFKKVATIKSAGSFDGSETYDEYTYYYTHYATNKINYVLDTVLRELAEECTEKGLGNAIGYLAYKHIYDRVVFESTQSGYSSFYPGREILLETMKQYKDDALPTSKVYWASLYRNPTGKLAYLFEKRSSIKIKKPSYVPTATGEFNFVEEEASVADYVFRKLYYKFMLMEESAFSGNKNKLEKMESLLTSDRDVFSSQYREQLNAPQPVIYTPCTTINIESFDRSLDPNYCFRTTSRQVENLKKYAEYTAIGLGILSLGASGGTSSLLIFSSADLVDILFTLYLESLSYPDNLVANPGAIQRTMNANPDFSYVSP
ncbi:hypothetical protein GOV05_01435 [Candidatus Woesearchaeota archaeon]|nr:hypothetical protein [Candidatus Woesearchaeota archaeon]